MRMDQRASEPTAVVVVVTRTGGFAGMRRAWRAEPRADEASVFLSLIARCPWDAGPQTEDGDGTDAGAAESRGADRFEWSIVARWDDVDEREARLDDDEVTGPWRELVDAVRDWNARAPRLSGRRGPSSSRA
jgi:hypothetical protein